MKVGLLADAPRHNLALMKLSSYHKAKGDQVILGKPADVQDCDIVYGSYLFSQRDHVDYAGGPGVDPFRRLDKEIDDMRPDYSLCNLDYSLGITWEYCPRKCGFCVVPKQHAPKNHRSIWDFHDVRFNKICLLNNNTFSDPRWLETFHEIWQANLTVIDENGYDLRLLNKAKVLALMRTKFQGFLHFAWDRMSDEQKVIAGLKMADPIRCTKRCLVYVLTGYDTSVQQDIYRVERIVELGWEPYVMIYNRSKDRQLRAFARMINYARCYKNYRSIFEAWADYKRDLHPRG